MPSNSTSNTRAWFGPITPPESPEPDPGPGSSNRNRQANPSNNEEGHAQHRWDDAKALEKALHGYLNSSM